MKELKTQKKYTVTFKRSPRPTGLAMVGHKDSWDIKYRKKCFGIIIQPKYSVFIIRVMIYKKDIMEDGNPNCAYRWVVIGTHHNRIEDAQKFIQDNFEKLSQKYTIRFED